MPSVGGSAGGGGGGGVHAAPGQQQDTMLNKLRAFCETRGLRHPNYEYIDTDIMVSLHSRVICIIVM